MLKSVLYVSRIAPSHLDTARWIDAMVSKADQRNRKIGITGGLVVTTRHFAQILEGPAEPLAGLLAIIAVDRRHIDMRILEEQNIDLPHFTNWKLSYFGPSSYVANKVEAALRDDLPADAVGTRDASRLIRGLISEP